MKKYFLSVLFFLGAGVWWTQDVEHPMFNMAPAAVVETIKPDSPYVEINGVEIPVEVVQTQAEVEKGLSGRERLDPESGMLFIFPKPDYYRFWMPNMNFPIDIIWIREGWIVGINPNVPNEFDPKNPKFYTPPQPVDRVLEVNAGFAQKKNIEIGNPLNFVQGRSGER